MEFEKYFSNSISMNDSDKLFLIKVNPDFKFIEFEKTNFMDIYFPYTPHKLNDHIRLLKIPDEYFIIVTKSSYIKVDSLDGVKQFIEDVL